jgi:hypothetical protein
MLEWSVRGSDVFPDDKARATCWQIATKKRIVIPAKAGIYRQYEAWIPAFAGMTMRVNG